jgi:membrane-associated protease RseP (regulator of RpoE activity)
MTPPPKHLWSGDWRSDSDATADELAALRAIPRPEVQEEEAPAEPPPTTVPRAPRPRRSPSRGLRTTTFIVLAVLVAGGIGWGLTSALGTNKSTAESGQTAYLGLRVTSHALMGGLIIRSVDPGSPAAKAGIHAGDVLARIGQIEVHTPGDVRALMLGRHPGDDVQLGIERGSISFAVVVTLTGQP